MQKHAIYLPSALQEPTARRAVQKLFQGAIDLAMNPRHPSGCMLVQSALATGPMSGAIQTELSACRTMAEGALRDRLALAIAQKDLPRSVNPEKLAGYIITVVWGLSVQSAGGATRAQLESVADMVLASLPSK